MTISTTALLKVTGAAVLTGGITLGALVTFNGTQTIQTAKTTITDYANKLNIFESNENKLIAKIQELKSVRDNLQAQLDTLLAEGNTNAETIAQLESDLQTANNKIAELESQITKTTENGEALSQRIVDLEAELQKANTQAAELQSTIDSNQTTAEPMTEAEMNELIGGETTTTPTEEEPTSSVVETSYKLLDPAKEILPGLSIKTSGTSIAITNNTGSEIEVREYPNGPLTKVGNTGFMIISNNTVTAEIYKAGTLIAKVTIQK